MKINVDRIKKNMILTMLLFCPFVALADSEVQEKLSLWRNHIITKGNWAGVEINDDFHSLANMGPNILPEVFAAYQNEESTHVLYYYGMLIKVLAHFDFYAYSREPLIIVGYQYQDLSKEKPFLSIEYAADGLSVLRGKDMVLMKRDKLLQWWNQRNSFTKRKDALSEIRSFTGKTRKEHLDFNKVKARNFFKTRVYGIYNIPHYIDLIDQDNNPFVFCEFLRISNHPEFQAFDMTKDLVSNGFKVEERYQTRESKIDLICEWWNEEKNKYTNLENLYNEINQKVERICPEKVVDYVNAPNEDN